MLVLACLLALSILLCLLLLGKNQLLLQQLTALRQHAYRWQGDNKDALRLLRLSTDELQRQLLEHFSEAQAKGGLPPSEQQCIAFLLNNMTEVVSLCAEKHLPVIQVVQLLAHKQHFDFHRLQAFIDQQGSDIQSAWQRNQLPAFFTLCNKLSRGKKHRPPLAQAS